MMNRRVYRVLTVCVTALFASLYACAAVEETSTAEQAGSNLQGSNLQGSNLQGSNLQGMTLLGFLVEGASLHSEPLTNLRVEHGELVAEQGSATLRGDQLEGVELLGQARNLGASPPATATVNYRITGVEPEDPDHDPTGTGDTYLYTLEQWNAATSAWVPACPEDADGRRAAIPVAAEWDETGARTDSSTMFTLACTTGVIAKCYRWGYKPWVSGYGDLAAMHQTCTRLARADYCGNGVSYTQDGTLINVWDKLPAPGPIQSRGVTPLGMLFEAGWDTSGAVCVSHARYSALGWLLTSPCPSKVPPLLLGGLVCNTLTLTNLLYPSATMYTESYLDLL